jgi:hypothetical protein
MRRCIWLIVFISGYAMAHGGNQTPNRTAATPGRVSADATTLKTQANDRAPVNQLKADDRQRFCVRNQSGRVNCIVYPAAGGH